MYISFMSCMYASSIPWSLYQVEGLLIVNECYTEWYVEFEALRQLIYDMDAICR